MRPDAGGFVSYRQMNGADSVLAGREIAAVAVDKDGILWVGAAQGLHVMDPRTGRSVSYEPEYGNVQSLTGRWIKCLYIDKEGIYWFGSYRGGVNKYDKNLNLFSVKLSDAFHESGSASPVVTSFAERRDGNVFVGTDGGGLFLFDRATEGLQRINMLPKGERGASPTVLAMKMTSRGQLYIGTYGGGLVILDPATGKAQHLVKGPGLSDLNADEIYCLMEDSKGAIWAGTNGAGINVIKDNKVIAKFSPNPGTNETKLPVNGYIRAFAEDTEGNIWIGTHGGGIAVYNPRTGRFSVFNKDNSTLPGDKVQALMTDSRGQLWIGTYGGGLCAFDRKSNAFINFTEKDGLQNTTIYQLVEDAQGLIWMSTNTGISSLDTRSRVFHNYNHSNGIQNSNPVHGSGICLSDGELFFGGLQGFNYFNPATLTTNRNVPVVILTDLKVSNKSVSPGDDSPIREQISVSKEIRLAYKQNFALSFVALNYTIPKQNHYAYKLEGFDKDWNYTGSLNSAYYTNLDPGTYTFRVKASNNDGVWSAADTSLKIYVKPPFWRTVYAYIFYVLAAGGLLLYSRHRGMKRLRKKFELEQERQEDRRVQELDRLKLKFLTNLSHEFRTPISLIMGPVEQLLAEQKQEKAVNKLHMIQRNGRRLLNLVNQLLDFRKMEEHELKLQLSEDDLVAFVKDVSHSFTDLSERKNIQFTVDSEPCALQVLFDHDKMERILFNLLSNAFKFTLAGGAVSVTLQELEENAGEGRQWVSIKVKDTGIGMPAETKEKIFQRFFQNDSIAAVLNQGTGIGLSITREFVNMHGGTIAVESEPGKGSIFTVTLPLMPAKRAAANGSPPILAGAAAVEDAGMTPGMADDTLPIQATGELPAILLVEDNDDFRFYLKDNLRNHYNVIEAADGKEGWQKALSGHPQLIVSDISMPVMDGIALTRKLKADKRTSHIPVILLTALTGEEERMEGLGTGANDYI
ncbi:MAG TPA: two-component regulator propeller domain-containing protein, partial [Chitinophagaceae bacterium]|nr:two-component regulator propeller domain-containing protein [Chitinophagaceae bacterium]